MTDGENQSRNSYEYAERRITMVKEYSRNKSVRISGGKKEIDAAEKMLDSISDIDEEIPQF